MDLEVVKTITLTPSDIEDAIVKYIFDKTGHSVSRLVYEITPESTPSGMLDYSDYEPAKLKKIRAYVEE